jgi:tetratricopeptide (TPR) repeat protein/transcriptional regulator with XRE-family HTH domain
VAEQGALGFGGLLRWLREDAGLTQDELAETARVSQRAISDLERGINRTARKDTAVLLAGALGLDGPAGERFVAAARGRVPPGEALVAGRGLGLSAATTAVLAGRPVAVPRELPADVAGFTGRAVELAELDLLLPGGQHGTGEAAGPVVISAVSGTAGVGKTALAVRWAHRVAGEFPDGQLYVNLRGYDPDQPVPAAEALAGFLRALGVFGADVPLGEAERAARYRSLLAGRRVLVMLDNAAAVEQVRPLLPGTGTVMVVVTSRDSLAGLVALDGARRLDLDLLPAGDAVALLTALIGERAEADPAAARALAGLCARLPLALRVAAELAAARPGMPLAGLAAELAGQRDRLELLDAGADPYGAVAGVFSWSYRHLPEDAGRLFRLLGVHPGQDWDRYAAAALADAGLAQASRLLALLARAHLIQPARAGRHGMHDLLRAYAAGLAAAHDDDRARRAALTRLFDYYLAGCAAAMDGLYPAAHHLRPDPPPVGTPIPELASHAAAQAWLDAELPTLAAVAAHAAGRGWPGHTIGLAATLSRYLDLGRGTEGLTIHGHALAAARESGDRAAEAWALANLGDLAGRQGRSQQAVEYSRQALAVARDAGDRRMQAGALQVLAKSYDWQSRYQQAAGCARQALALNRERGDQIGEAISLYWVGIEAGRQGRYRQAASYLRQVLTLSPQTGEPGDGWTLASLGGIYYLQGYYPQAAARLQQALTMARESGDRYNEGQALTWLGEICHRQGRYDQAAGYHRQALTLCQQIGDRGREADALNGAGQTLLATGQPGQARACHIAALTLARQTGNRAQQARALARLADVCRQGHLDQAAEYDQQAVALFGEIGARGGQADALNGAGETLLAAGQPGQARDQHAAALALARRTGDRYQQARAHHGLAAACHAAGDPGPARQHGQRALAIYTKLGVPEAARLPAPALDPGRYQAASHAGAPARSR